MWPPTTPPYPMDTPPLPPGPPPPPPEKSTMALVRIPDHVSSRTFLKHLEKLNCPSVCFGNSLQDFQASLGIGALTTRTLRCQGCDGSVPVDSHGHPSISAIMGHLNTKHGARSSYKCSKCELFTCSRRHFKDHNRRKHDGAAHIKILTCDPQFIYSWLSTAQRCFPASEDDIMKAVRHLYSSASDVQKGRLD